MAKPRRTNRAGVGAPGGTPRQGARPAAQNGSGTTDKTANTTKGANGTNSQSATDGSAATNSSTATNAPKNGSTNEVKPTVNGNSTGTTPSVRRTSTASSTGRPVVSSIRERTGTQRPQNRLRYVVKKPWWQQNLPVLIAVTSVVVLIAIFVVIAHNATGATTGNVDASVFKTITTVPQSDFDKVGTGGQTNPMKALPSSGRLPVSSTGKPTMVYIGAEYCPFCAAERWSVVIALSRFGTWQGLNTTASSASDVYPSTNTFTFLNATYTSKYFNFDSKEIQDGNGNALQSLNSTEQALFDKYNAPPFVSSQNKGGIPFIVYGDSSGAQYATYSAGFSPALLHQGQDPNGTPLSYQEIASKLSNPNDPVTQGTMGNANYITAAICKITNNADSGVCNSQTIQQIVGQLPKGS
jgi:hypothetical protein